MKIKNSLKKNIQCKTKNSKEKKSIKYFYHFLKLFLRVLLLLMDKRNHIGFFLKLFYIIKGLKTIYNIYKEKESRN